MAISLEARTVRFGEVERIAGSAKFADPESLGSFNVIAPQYNRILSDCMKSRWKVPSVASLHCSDTTPSKSKEEACLGAVYHRELGEVKVIALLAFLCIWVEDPSLWDGAAHIYGGLTFPPL